MATRRALLVLLVIAVGTGGTSAYAAHQKNMDLRADSIGQSYLLRFSVARSM